MTPPPLDADLPWLHPAQQAFNAAIASGRLGHALLVQASPVPGAPDQVAVSAPPAGLFGKALLGPHLLFLLGAGDTYSEGVWITVTA